jgi:hypothetical protein
MHQHVIRSPLFPLCYEEVEDDFHALFICSRIQGCWDAAGLMSILDSRRDAMDDVCVVLFDVCNKRMTIIQHYRTISINFHRRILSS